MNYRHAYHAGNHADVLKHVVLARVLDYLRQKDKPFAVLDAHAGIGRYDLKGAEAFKTGEWKDGIGKLLAEPLPPDVRRLLAALSQHHPRPQSGWQLAHLSGFTGSDRPAAAPRATASSSMNFIPPMPTLWRHAMPADKRVRVHAA